MTTCCTKLEAYASLTTVGSYCIVFDTIVEDVSAELVGDRPWGVGNSPKSARARVLALASGIRT